MLVCILLTIVLILIPQSLTQSLSPVFIDSESVVKCQGQGQPESCLVPVKQLSKGSRSAFAFNAPFYTDPPPWYNYKLAKIGQEFFKRNLVGFSIAQLYGFCIISSSVDYIRIFASAGNASSTIERARKRYLINGLLAFYVGEVELPKQLSESESSNQVQEDENSKYDYFEFLNTIRSIHQKVGAKALYIPERYKKSIIQNPLEKLRYPKVWEAFFKDVQESKYLRRFKYKKIFPPQNASGTDIHFNQFAMMVQLWAILGLPLLFPEKVFMPIPKNDRDEEWLGYLHFYSLIFYTMGVEDKHNFGLQPSLPEAKKYYWDFMEEYLLPGFVHFDQSPESMFMIELAIEGINLATIPTFDLASTLVQVLNLLNVPTPNLYKILEPRGKLNVDLLFPIAINFLSQSDLYRNLANHAAAGVMSGSAMEEFGININNFTDFTIGTKWLTEETLRTTDIWLIKEQEMRSKRSI